MSTHDDDDDEDGDGDDDALSFSSAASARVNVDGDGGEKTKGSIVIATVVVNALRVDPISAAARRVGGGEDVSGDFGDLLVRS